MNESVFFQLSEEQILIAARVFASRGGKSKSDAKVASSRKNLDAANKAKSGMIRPSSFVFYDLIPVDICDGKDFKLKARIRAKTSIARHPEQLKPCCICGSKDKIHAHHEDYSKPFRVVFLCKSHHSQYHAQKNRALHRKQFLKHKEIVLRK